MATPIISDLMHFLDQSVTAYHAVLTSEEKLRRHNFIKLDEKNRTVILIQEKNIM